MQEAKIERSDAWRPDEDQLLAETVISYIRSGSSQLRAFQEAAVTLNRTAGACGFRWNSAIRKQYEKQIAEAKAHRKQRDVKETPGRTRKIQDAVQEEYGSPAVDSPLDHIIRLTEQAKATIHNMANQIKQLEHKLETLEEENRMLKKELRHNGGAVGRSEETERLLELLKRAKELGVLNS